MQGAGSGGEVYAAEPLVKPDNRRRSSVQLSNASVRHVESSLLPSLVQAPAEAEYAVNPTNSASLVYAPGRRDVNRHFSVNPESSQGENISDQHKWGAEKMRPETTRSQPEASERVHTNSTNVAQDRETFDIQPSGSKDDSQELSLNCSGNLVVEQSKIEGIAAPMECTSLLASSEPISRSQTKPQNPSRNETKHSSKDASNETSSGKSCRSKKRSNQNELSRRPSPGFIGSRTTERGSVRPHRKLPLSKNKTKARREPSNSPNDHRDSGIMANELSDRLSSGQDTAPADSNIEDALRPAKPRKPVNAEVDPFQPFKHDSSGKISPCENDVLCGLCGRWVQFRSKFKNHPGNLNYLKVAKRAKSRHSNADDFFVDVIETIGAMNPPGRFLKLGNDGHFYLMDEERVDVKVKKAFRELKSPTGSSDEKAPKTMTEVPMKEEQGNRRRRRREIVSHCCSSVKQRQASDDSNSNKRASPWKRRRCAEESQDNCRKSPQSCDLVVTPSIQSSQKKPIILLERDPNDIYVEELAFLYHDPPAPAGGDSLEEEVDVLEPLPEAPPLPNPPPDTSAKWAFCEHSRVLHGDFRNVDLIPNVDRIFLAQMMQRDDITLVSEGLSAGLNEDLWNLGFLERTVGNKTYHKFRKFMRRELKNKVVFQETDGFLAMKVSDFLRYLQRRELALHPKGNGTNDRMFSYVDSKDQEQTIDVIDCVLYMIDFDLPKLLPELCADFRKQFKVSEMLPGGRWCMMNKVPECGRPFMGPNLYISPGGGFTHLHQDGHGTVDSGHSVMAGYNEVIMLRRMPERHKQNACQMVPTVFESRATSTSYDALYGLPHGDNQGDRPDWPCVETVEQWRKMNYYPSVFILKPGQHVHINKGRLHAFRKLLLDELPETDCHAKLRKELIQMENLTKAPLCMSVAYDWMYQGYDGEGINREVAATVECATLCRNHHRQSLAIPETTLLQMAKTLNPKPDLDDKLKERSTDGSMLAFENGGQSSGRNSCPTDLEICRGILPSLRHVVNKDLSAVAAARNRVSFNAINPGRCEKVSVALGTDADENPLTVSVDPYGSDYFCKLCHRELANCYMHCDGCEKLLSRDFNICIQCHGEENPPYARLIQMHPKKSRRHSTVNHTGDMHFSRSKHCPCKNGPVCVECGYCCGCSCRCHTWFTLHSRFFSGKDEERLLTRIVDAVGSNPVRFSAETEARLSVAMDRNGAGYLAKRGLLANHPRNSDAHPVSSQPDHLGAADGASPSEDNLTTDIVEGDVKEAKDEPCHASASVGEDDVNFKPNNSDAQLVSSQPDSLGAAEDASPSEDKLTNVGREDEIEEAKDEPRHVSGSFKTENPDAKAVSSQPDFLGAAEDASPSEDNLKTGGGEGDVEDAKDEPCHPSACLKPENSDAHPVSQSNSLRAEDDASPSEDKLTTGGGEVDIEEAKDEPCHASASDGEDGIEGVRNEPCHASAGLRPENNAPPVYDSVLKDKPLSNLNSKDDGREDERRRHHASLGSLVCVGVAASIETLSDGVNISKDDNKCQGVEIEDQSNVVVDSRSWNGRVKDAALAPSDGVERGDSSDLSLQPERPVRAMIGDLTSSEENNPAAGSCNMREAFPSTLHRILDTCEREGLTDIASFSGDGRSFSIHKTDRFTSDLMPRFMGRQVKWNSFESQLNKYGFTCISRGPGQAAYRHDLFLKGEVALCVNMNFEGKCYAESESDDQGNKVECSDTYTNEKVQNNGEKEDSACFGAEADSEILSIDNGEGPIAERETGSISATMIVTSSEGMDNAQNKDVCLATSTCNVRLKRSASKMMVSVPSRLSKRGFEQLSRKSSQERRVRNRKGVFDDSLLSKVEEIEVGDPSRLSPKKS